MTSQRPSHQRIARALLRLYPEAFRRRFGEDLVQLIGNVVGDARAGRAGRSGVLATWLGIVVDVIRTAPAEHLDQRRVAHSLTRPASAATKALGVLGILGGLLLVAGYIPAIDWAGFFQLRLIVFCAGTITIAIAVHRRQAVRSRYLSLAATVVVVLGNAWYLAMIVLADGRPQFPAPDPEFRQVLFWAGVALWLGDGIFALVALWLGALSRWASLLLAIGSLVTFLGMGGLGDRFPWLVGLIELATPALWWGVALLGVGWILLGIDVVTRRRPAPASISPAPHANEARTAEHLG